MAIISASSIFDKRREFFHDELTMPADLLKTHRANDLAVEKAYGWEKILDDEQIIVEKLFKLYERFTAAI